MFLKKSLLFTTALALLMFAGQASAQGVSFTHVTDGTAGMALGTDAIVVELAVTGVPVLPVVASYTIGFDYPTDLLTLSSAVDGNGKSIILLGTVSALHNPPASPPAVLARVTFTPKSDVTDQAFSIGVKSVAGNYPPELDAIIQANIPPAIMFNPDGDTGPGDGNGTNGDTGTPTPEPTELSVSVTSGGASEVNQIGAGAEVVVDVAVSAGPVFRADVTFVVDPPMATINPLASTAATGLQVLGIDGMTVGLIGLSADGSLGSVAFTTNEDYDGSTLSINVVSPVNLITTTGKSFRGCSRDGRDGQCVLALSRSRCNCGRSSLW